MYPMQYAFLSQQATCPRCTVQLTGFTVVQVGQVFHPEQDRIVSVRECARAQVRFPLTMCSAEVAAKRYIFTHCQIQVQ